MLNRSGRHRHSCFLPSLKRKAFDLSPLSMMSAIGNVRDALFKLWKFLLVVCLEFHFVFLGVFFSFIYFWLRWVFVAACRLSPVAASRGHSLLQCAASHCGGVSCCGAQALGVWASVVAARGLSSCGTWAQGCMGFSSHRLQALECKLSSCGAWA